MAGVTDDRARAAYFMDALAELKRPGSSLERARERYVTGVDTLEEFEAFLERYFTGSPPDYWREHWRVP